MQGVDPRLVIVFIWIIGCSLMAFALLLRRPSHLPGLGYALFVAFLVRLIPALILPRGAAYEMHVFRQAAQVALEGQSVYLSGVPHPYLPFLLYWLVSAHWLTEYIGLSFPFWVKVPSILAETATTGLVYSAIQQRRTKCNAIFGSWIYAVNPVTILVAAYQGQFDAIPLLCVLSAWYLSEFHSNRQWALTLSAFVLGVGVLSKVWPIILLPIVLLRLPHWRLWLRYTLTTAVVPAIGVLFYELLFPGSLPAILRRSITVGAVPGWWGYSAILNVIVELTGHGFKLYSWFASAGKLVALICGTIVIFFTRNRPALASLMLTILTLFALIPNLGLQGLSWIVPLAVIMGLLNELKWYLAGVMLHMLISYWGIHLTSGLYLLMPAESANIIIQLSSLTAWGVVVLWWGQQVLHRRFLPQVFFPQGQRV